MTLKRRKQLAIVILTVAIILAGYIALPDEQVAPGELPDTLLFRLLLFLEKIEAAHLLGHSLTFGGVAFLLAEWGAFGQRGNRNLAWRYVILGAIIMEVVQLPLGWEATSTISEWLRRTGFDFLVDGLAAGGGLYLARRFDGWMDATKTQGAESRLSG